MNEIHNKLSEIYEWYTDNLKHAGAGPSRPAPTAPPGSSHPSFETASRLTLEVYVEVPGSAEIGLICPKASFHPGWLNTGDRGSTSGLFRCHCQSGGDFQQPANRPLQGDHTAHLQFSRKAPPEKLSITMNQKRRLILISTACHPHNSTGGTSKLIPASCLFAYI
jgi:hypothetical protein